MGGARTGSTPGGARLQRASDPIVDIEARRAPVRWSLLTRHAQVLLWIARHEDARVRDVAVGVGITDRSATRIIGELVAEGYVRRTQAGRRRRYRVCFDRRLHHPAEDDASVGGLLAAFSSPGRSIGEQRAS